jgi:hypothetical protein
MGMKKFLLFAIFLVSLSFLISSAKAHWWNSTWKYRREIMINNTQNSNDLIDYQVAINLIYDSNMQPDFSDIRFTWYNSTNRTETEIPYWIENYSTSQNATVWIKVPFIPSNITNIGYGNGTQIIYIYYGNTTPVSSKSNGDNTFDFFDDFVGTSINTSKWTTYNLGESNVSNGYFYLINPGDWWSGTAYHRAIRTISTFNNHIVEMLARIPQSITTGVYYYYHGLHVWKYDQSIGCSSTGCAWGIDIGKQYDIQYYKTSWVGVGGYAYVHNHETEWRILRAIIRANNNIKGELLYPNRTLIGGRIDGWYYSNYYPGIAGYAININSLSQVDWFLIRKYTDPEPTYLIGVEETNYPPSITIFSPLNQSYYGSIDFVFKATDDLDENFTVRAYLNNELNYENLYYQNDTQISYSKTLPMGTYNFTVYAEDSYGVSSQQEVIFTSLGYCGDNVCQTDYENNMNCFKDCGGTARQFTVGIGSIVLAFGGLMLLATAFASSPTEGKDYVFKIFIAVIGIILMVYGIIYLINL